MYKHIQIISIGKLKSPYLKEGIQDYIKRLKPFCKLDCIELKEEGIEKEAIKIEKHIDENTFLLDEKGKSYNSIEFSKFIGSRDKFTFIIGSSDGVSPNLKSKIKKISLSQMTLLHEMTQLLFLEQIYRAFMILSNRTYHK